jgi:hypothetical protein
MVEVITSCNRQFFITFNPSLYIYYNISLYICQVEYTMKGPDYIHKDIVHTRTTVVVSLHRIDILTCSAITVKCFSRCFLSSIMEYYYSFLDFSENGSEQSTFSPCFYIFIVTRYVFMSMNFLFGQCISHYVPFFPTMLH